MGHTGAWVAAALLSSGVALAQQRVEGAKDPDALFHSADPQLNANKQVVYHIFRDILEGGDVAAVDRYLTARYIQHNPNIPSGRDGLRRMVAARKPGEVSAKLAAHVVSVVAEGDFVVVGTVQRLPDPRSPGGTYTTTHFDMWRIQEGRADEHWDAATLGPPPALNPSAP